MRNFIERVIPLFRISSNILVKYRVSRLYELLSKEQSLITAADKDQMKDLLHKILEFSKGEL